MSEAEETTETVETTITGEDVVAETETTTEEATFDYGGLDESLYEGEKLSRDKVKEYLSAKDEELASITKQKDDFQKTLSAKGQVPKKVEDYYNKYESEKYGSLKENELVIDAMQALAETYKDAGISPKQGDKIYDTMFRLFEKTGQIDMRSKEELTKEHNKWVESERAKLGEDSDTIINTAVKYIKDNRFINESAQNKIIGLMEGEAGGAELISAIYSMSLRAGTGNIPLAPKTVAGLPTDAELAVEIKTATPARRKEIYAQREKAGRTGSLLSFGDIKQKGVWNG